MTFPLPVIKPRTYLSPSSLSKWKNCPSDFYHYYLSGNPYIESKSNYTACLGSAFDSILKNYIARKKGMTDPHLEINALFRKIKPAVGVDMEAVISKAKEMATRFIELKLIERFLDASSILAERELYQIRGGVPILGIPDIVCDGVPIDFKLRGFNSTNNQSPTPGFRFRISSTGTKLPPHKECGEIRLEDKKEDWATQVLWYNWLLGNSEYKYEIYEVLQWDGDWQLAIHTGSISSIFAVNTWQEVQGLWEMINQLYVDIPPAMPSRSRCERYGSVCEMAIYCTPYRDTLGSPNRSDYV